MTVYDPNKMYCRGNEWNVSYEQVSGVPGRDYSVTTLNVFKVHDDEPNQWGGRGTTERHSEFDGLVFPTPTECRQFALDHDLIHEFARQYTLVSS